MKRYMGRDNICPNGYECDGAVVGCLAKSLNWIGMLEPRDPPYEGLSFKWFVQELCRMKIPIACKRVFRKRCERAALPAHIDLICNDLKDIMSILEQSLCGLDLKDYSNQQKG